LKLKAEARVLGVANGSEWERNVNGKVVGSQAWEDAPFICGS